MHDHPSLTLTDTRRRHLVRAAARLIGPADAEDAVQDACVRALEAAPLELTAAQAWLLTVVRHVAVDRLRRRQWMQHWVAEAADGGPALTSPSAEQEAMLAEQASLALQRLAALLPPEDGAAVLLHEVFEASHADIAQAAGRSEVASRQQLRRALLRLRASGRPGDATDLDPPQETVFRLYLQALRLRDPHVLWALLRQPPIRAVAGGRRPSVPAAPVPEPQVSSSLVQADGQWALVLTLDGVTLCVVPLGVQAGMEPESLAS